MENPGYSAESKVPPMQIDTMSPQMASSNDPLNLHEKLHLPTGNSHDPLNVHGKLNSEWANVFAEPGESTMPEPIWNFFEKMYKILFKIFYLIPAIIIGPFIIIITALLMALQNFVLLWVSQPCFVCFKKCMVISEKYFWVVLDTFMKPWCRVLGFCFSEIRFRYQKFEDQPSTDIFIV